MKKYDLDLLKKNLAENFDVDPKGWDKEEIKALLCDSLDAEEFEERGFRFGSSQDSWKAVLEMADHIEAGEPIPETLSLWFLNALNKTKKEDPKELMRQLGLIERGTTRKFNRYDIAAKMIELVEGEGLIKAEAARHCAEEFGCHPETALMWYRKRKEIYER